MYEEALRILKKLEEKNYEAYIIGGYPRDKYLNIESKDIDICTNATPEEIKKIFDNVDDTYSEYGNVILNNKYQITTYRKDEYLSNRRDVKIEYVNTLEEDLKRRDFIINTLCINSNGEYIDKMNAIEDLENRIIRIIGNNDKLKDDPLRILRAIRFSCILDFKIDKKLEEGIIQYGYLIETLSNYRKKLELDKFNEKGYQLLKKYDLNKYLIDLEK